MQRSIYISAQIQQVIDLYQELIEQRKSNTSVWEELSGMSAILMETHQKGNSAACLQLSNWHPELIGRSDADILAADLAKADFDLTIAREHAYDTWAQVKTWGRQPFNPLFENTVDVMLAGDTEQLIFLLRRHPMLINERSVYNHRATLLHYIGSNGVETRRQVVPSNLPQLTQLLLSAGADPDATAFLYRSQYTTMELLTTSAHPADAGVMADTVSIFENNKRNIKL